MFNIFTKRWGGVFFRCLLAFMLWGYEAGACIDSPDEIKLPGATFEAERITIEAPKIKQGNTSGRYKITFGNTVLSYDDGKKCWFHLNSKKCLSQQVAAQSKAGGSYHVAIKKNGREIGVVELDDQGKKLYAYSISNAGVKDSNKPYLTFSETNRLHCRAIDCGPGLTVTAYDRGRPIGTYESKPSTSTQRGIQQKGSQTHSGSLNLRGQRVSSQGCHVDVKRM